MDAQVKGGISVGDEVHIIGGRWQGIRGTVLRVFSPINKQARIFIRANAVNPRRYLVRADEVEKVKKYSR